MEVHQDLKFLSEDSSSLSNGFLEVTLTQEGLISRIQQPADGSDLRIQQGLYEYDGLLTNSDLYAFNPQHIPR